MLRYNHILDQTFIRNVQFDSLKVEQVQADLNGSPTIQPSEGTIVYTKNSSNTGTFYIGLGDTNASP